MSTSVNDLEAEILNLPPEDRAWLLERLIASFEPKSSAQQAWAALAKSRADDVRQGKVAMGLGADAMLRVKSRVG
jgi:putative addiction module component (TIGR02574 family)